MPKVKSKQIISSCCAFGSDGTEEVWVPQEECPINREIQRERKKHLSVPTGMENPKVKECACILYSGYLGAERAPKCPYYMGTKKVTQNDGRRKYVVSCKASNPNHNPNLN